MSEVPVLCPTAVRPGPNTRVAEMTRIHYGRSLPRRSGRGEIRCPAQCTCSRSWARPPNGLALSHHVRAEQVELDFPDDVGDARLTGLAGREVAGFPGLAGAGPVRAIAGEGGGGEDLEQERGEREIGLLRGKKPRPYPSRRPGRAGS